MSNVKYLAFVTSNTKKLFSWGVLNLINFDTREQYCSIFGTVQTDVLKKKFTFLFISSLCLYYFSFFPLLLFSSFFLLLLLSAVTPSSLFLLLSSPASSPHGFEWCFFFFFVPLSLFLFFSSLSLSLSLSSSAFADPIPIQFKLSPAAGSLRIQSSARRLKLADLCSPTGSRRSKALLAQWQSSIFTCHPPQLLPSISLPMLGWVWSLIDLLG